jgi:ATP-dependent DNA helicase RecG
MSTRRSGRYFSDRFGNRTGCLRFVKGKSDEELLAYYLLTKGKFLTNLGVLWIGRREDRATLANAPVVQFLKFDENGAKVNKLVWDDFSRNPMDLIEAIWTQAPDWRESYELPDGLFRTQVPHFDEVVIRELLANALVHRPYTTRGDIFINLYPDRLEVHNPGLLPLGVTPANILHTSIKRNELLAKVFYDLKLMEREGSGYDRIYEALLSTGRPGPVVKEGDDRVVVTVQRRILKPEVIDFMIKASQTFALTQKERITLGLIAQQEAVTLTELTRLLELKSAEERRPWLGRLVELGIVKTKGRTKGTMYFVDAKLLRKLEFQGKTTLKTIEPHRLRELVLSDLRRYPDASISEIHSRIGTEIALRDLRRELYHLAESGEIRIKGTKRWARYSIDQTGSNPATLVYRNRPPQRRPPKNR